MKRINRYGLNRQKRRILMLSITFTKALTGAVKKNRIGLCVRIYFNRFFIYHIQNIYYLPIYNKS